MRRKYFDRALLPNPIFYYQAVFPGLKATFDWTNVCCCFHDDKRPSLYLHLPSGGFYCFSCGKKGGDVIAFHRQRYGVSFVETVNFFGAWAYV